MSENEMSHMQFLRAQFLSAEPLAGAKRTQRRRPSREIAMLRSFVKASEQMPAHEVEAAVKYLADRYLGVKLWR